MDSIQGAAKAIEMKLASIEAFAINHLYLTGGCLVAAAYDIQH
jgi:hypothetical protein